jgi:hypothetical protein
MVQEPSTDGEEVAETLSARGPDLFDDPISGRPLTNDLGETIGPCLQKGRQFLQGALPILPGRKSEVLADLSQST